MARTNRPVNAGTPLRMPKMSSTLPAAIQPVAARIRIAAVPIAGAAACSSSTKTRNRIAAAPIAAASMASVPAPRVRRTAVPYSSSLAFFRLRRPMARCSFLRNVTAMKNAIAPAKHPQAYSTRISRTCACSCAA